MSGAGNRFHVEFNSGHLEERDKQEASALLMCIDDADT
jgi:hypothetical protein